MLLKLGVRREAAVISVTYQIRESGSNRVLLDTSPAHLFDVADDKAGGAYRANVVDHFPVWFNILLHAADGEAATGNVATKEMVVIPPGRYKANVTVNSGHLGFTISREFTVGSDPLFTIWA
jgi:hypothetical protein